MANKMKALYAIVLPKSTNAPGITRSAEDVNEERLNDNFRTITNELMKLWDGGEQNLKVMSSRVSQTERDLAAMNQVVNGIQADTIANTTAIQQMPDTIVAVVSETINGYATVTYVDTATGAISSDLVDASENLSSQITQLANLLNVEISDRVTLGDVVSELNSWVRVVGQIGSANPGVIIGRSDSESRFKAEAAAIFFYRGSDADALESNADVLLDAEGRLKANNADIGSMLLGNAFDIDVVTANSVDFLHITGRS